MVRIGDAVFSSSIFVPSSVTNQGKVQCILSNRKLIFSWVFVMAKDLCFLTEQNKFWYRKSILNVRYMDAVLILLQVIMKWKHLVMDGERPTRCFWPVFVCISPSGVPKIPQTV